MDATKEDDDILGASSDSTTTTNKDDDLTCSATSSSPQKQNEDSENDSILECPICLQSSVHPVELPCSHIFCFLCIKGVAAQGNSRCAICRQNIPNNVLTNPRLKDISQLYKDPKLLQTFQWFYESRGGGWWMYDERTMQELEKAYDSKLPTCRVLIAGNLYEIDFGQMIQYRLNNPSLFRRIKRDYGTVEKRGIAGIRLNNQGSNSQDTGAAGNHPSSGDGSRIGLRSVPHPGSAELFEIESDEDDDENEDDDEDEEEEDDDMELENSEDDEQGESGDSEGDEEARDGARAPTRRSDRSNSSSNNQTPPSTPSGQNGSYSQFNGTSTGSGRGSRCGGVSRNLPNSRNSSSADSTSENNSSEPNNGTTTEVNSGESVENVENRQPSSLSSPTSSAPPSSVMFDIDELNVNAPLDNNGSLSYIIIGPSSLQIRLQYNSNTNYEMDEIL